MAIVKKYVDMMGGTISVQSKKHEGTTFTNFFCKFLTHANTSIRNAVTYIYISIPALFLTLGFKCNLKNITDSALDIIKGFLTNRDINFKIQREDAKIPFTSSDGLFFIAIPVNPMIAFIGVLISWDICDKNAVFALFAATDVQYPTGNDGSCP